MKKVLLLVSMLVFAFSAIVFAQTVPADKMTVDLKTSWEVKGNQKAVFFKHATHVDTAKLACNQCHKDPKGGDKVVLSGEIKGTNDKNAAHQYCWSCHAKQSPDPVKKVCTKCHTGK